MKKLLAEEITDEEYEALIEKMTSDAKGLALEAWSQADSGTSYLRIANREFEEGNIKEAIEDCAKAHYFLESALRFVSSTSDLGKALKEKAND
jgi:hypothetical protein